MKIKKLSIIFLVGFALIAFKAYAQGESLYDFLKSEDEIKASYEYPSMKIASSSEGKVKLKAHTPITIRCDKEINTRDIVSGSEVKFSVLADVKDSNDMILIKAGSPVTAQISFARSKGMIGRSGEVTISDFHTVAVDGAYVPLSASVSAKAEDKTVLSIVLSVVICPLFLLLNGDDAQVSVGTTKTAYTVSDVYVNAERL